MLDSTVIINGIFEAITLVLTVFLPYILWIGIPGLIGFLLFKGKVGGNIGSLFGVILLFTVGPLS